MEPAGQAGLTVAHTDGVRTTNKSDDITLGRYDDIPPEQIRADLIRFARLLLRLDEEGRFAPLHPPCAVPPGGSAARKLFAP